jgi:ABC-type nickel/cobalt efflux system permease component RcnA
MQVTCEIPGERMRGMRQVEAILRLLVIIMMVLGGTTLLRATMPPSPQAWMEADADYAGSPSDHPAIQDAGDRHSHDQAAPDHFHEAVVPETGRAVGRHTSQRLRLRLAREELPPSLLLGLERPPRFVAPA